MIVINPPATPSHRMDLVADSRQERSGAAPIQAQSWVELSEPLAITLDDEPVGDDEELAQFLKAGTGRFRYDYVRLACTFGPKAPERFEKAWLKVRLKPQAKNPPEEPIAWSIFPINDYDTFEETSSSKIGGKLKILSAEVAETTKLLKKLYSVRGFKEGMADPFWELTGTETTSLEGIFRFHLVVRSAARSRTSGEVRLEAVIRKRLFVAFRHKKPFDQSPSHEFRLPPA